MPTARVHCFSTSGCNDIPQLISLNCICWCLIEISSLHKYWGKMQLEVLSRFSHCQEPPFPPPPLRHLNCRQICSINCLSVTICMIGIYLYSCVFVYLYICVFIYLCICVSVIDENSRSQKILWELAARILVRSREILFYFSYPSRNSRIDRANSRSRLDTRDKEGTNLELVSNNEIIKISISSRKNEIIIKFCLLKSSVQ